MKKILIALLLVIIMFASGVNSAKAEDTAMYIAQFVEATTGLAGEKFYVHAHNVKSVLPSLLKFSTTLVWSSPQGVDKIQFTDFDAEANCDTLTMTVTGYHQFDSDDQYIGGNPIALPEFNRADLVSTACELKA